MVNETPIVCPVPPPHGADAPFTPCDIAELDPLLLHLRTGSPTSDTLIFPRGTITADGRLDLCKQNVGVDGCRAVVSVLHGNSHVHSLLLGTDGIGDAGAEAVAELVKRSETLSTVYLGCNRIGAEGVSRLADALAENRTVTGLWLKRNPIGDDGAFALARMLRCNQTLRVLDLVNSGIGADGLTAILVALTEANCTVERLYLGGNGLGVGSAPLLADMLRANTNLQALLLNVNSLGDAGAAIVAEALRTNRTLHELGLASNGIGAVGLCSLLEVTRTHPSLRILDLGYTRSTRALGGQPNRFGDARSLDALSDFFHDGTSLASFDIRGTGISGKHPVYEAALALREHPLPPVMEEVTHIRSVYR